MATNFHPDLPNDQLHPPKDFSVSNNSSVLTKSDAGLLDWNTSPYGTETRITCGPDIAGGLHERKFYVFLDESNKGECYFDVAGETDTHVPIPGYHQIKIDIAANDSAITIASEIKQEFDRQTGSWGKLTTTVDGTGKVTFNGMTDSPDTVDGDTNFTFVNTKTYTGTTVLTSTNGVISWETGGGGSGTVTDVTGTAPIVSSGGTTPAISIPQASSTTDGYLSSSNWSTFNGKQNAISLTTSGTSGVATFSGNTLNIPNYSSGSSATNIPIKAFGSNLSTGLWIKNMQDTHAYKFSLAPRGANFTLVEAMAGACYYYRQGERFDNFRGFISGTAGQRVEIVVFSVSTLCGVTHSDNNAALGSQSVVLSGDRNADCFSIPGASPFSTDGMIVIAVSIPGRDNVSFQMQSRLVIL
jgi:hypothetical protein